MNEEIKQKIEEGLKEGEGVEYTPGLIHVGRGFEATRESIFPSPERLECLKLAYETVYKLDASNPGEWARKTDLEKKEVVDGLFELADKNWQWLTK